MYSMCMWLKEPGLYCSVCVSVGLRKARTVSEVYVGGWFGVGYDSCVCGERVLSVQLGERKERDEEEEEQEEEEEEEEKK